MQPQAFVPYNKQAGLRTSRRGGCGLVLGAFRTYRARARGRARARAGACSEERRAKRGRAPRMAQRPTNLNALNRPSRPMRESLSWRPRCPRCPRHPPAAPSHPPTSHAPCLLALQSPPLRPQPLATCPCARAPRQSPGRLRLAPRRTWTTTKLIRPGRTWGRRRRMGAGGRCPTPCRN